MDDSAIAARLARISAELAANPQEEPTPLRICERALEIVRACDHCSITVRRKRQLETLAATSELADRLSTLQSDLGEGPCLEALDEREYYLSHDLAEDPRWPKWGPAAAEGGVRSVVAVRLSSGDESLGSMNLYSHDKGAFAGEDHDLAMIYATHAGIALSSAKLITGLQTALTTRHEIGLAQGILMARYGLDVPRSFEVLQRYSRDSNTKLREVAAQVIAHGGLPHAEDTPTDP